MQGCIYLIGHNWNDDHGHCFNAEGLSVKKESMKNGIKVREK